MEPVKPVLKNIYRTIYRKDLSWSHFDNELRLQQKHQVKDQQSCKFVTKVFHTWVYGRFIETQSNLRKKKLHRMKWSSIFLGGSFSKRDNARNPIQYTFSEIMTPSCKWGKAISLLC